MEEEKKLKPATRTYFDAIGTIEFKQGDFVPNQKGKNNPNYIYSRLAFFLKNNEQKIRISLMGGFTPETKIYCFNDNKESMVINFKDRDNETLIKQVSTLNLLQVGLNKVETPKINKETQEIVMKDGKPEMIRVWNYQNFLTDYDLINFLGQNIKSDMRVRITGEIIFNMYEGKLQKNYKINRIYFLTEEEYEDRFNLKVDVLIDKNSLNDSDVVIQGDNENKVKINAMVYHQVNKNKREVLPLELFYVFIEEDKEKANKLIKKLFEIKDETIRKISLECHIFNGKIYNSLSSEELDFEISDEVQELIDAGFMDKEEVIKNLTPKYSEVKFVDEIHFDKPILIKKDGVGILAIDDELYTRDDLKNLEILDDKKAKSKLKETNSVSNVDDEDTTLDDFLDDDDLPF